MPATHPAARTVLVSAAGLGIGVAMMGGGGIATADPAPSTPSVASTTPSAPSVGTPGVASAADVPEVPDPGADDDAALMAPMILDPDATPTPAASTESPTADESEETAADVPPTFDPSVTSPSDPTLSDGSASSSTSPTDPPSSPLPPTGSSEPSPAPSGSESSSVTAVENTDYPIPPLDPSQPAPAPSMSGAVPTAQPSSTKASNASVTSTPKPPAARSADDGLPDTGIDAVPMLILGLGLVVVGVALVLFTRRRGRH